MSAIAGIISLDGGPADSRILEAMLDRLEHRGPDRRGAWVDGPAALGHLALWTTPESTIEQLPMRDPGSGAMITGDARLDNRDDLIQSMGLASATPDCALILAAYQKWGEACVEHFLGDFAFAIWDARIRKLFCARDHMGVKPFYYACVPERFFVFATEIKAVLGVPGVSDAINERRVADAFVHLINDPAATYYTHVLRLPAAHCLTLTDEATLRRYWRLNPDRELRLGSDEEYAEGFRERFVRAVDCRLRSSHPVGSMLSGGLDSSSVACVARDLLRAAGKPRLNTFSAVFDEVSQCDERPYIQTVLDQGHCDPDFITLDSLSPLIDSQSIMWHLDEPLSASNLYLSWSAYGHAQQRGVRVILDGFDGDTTVSHGSGRLLELARARRWLDLAAELRGGARNFGGNFWLDSWGRWIWKHHPAPRAIARAWRGAVRRMSPSRPSAAVGPDAAEIINPDLSAKLGLREIIRQGTPPMKDERDRHFRILEREIMSKCAELFAHASGAFEVEVRLPFMDVPLIEYCLSLPSEQKVRRGYTRYVMRGGMKGILPEKIRWRGGKSDLGPSFERGLRKFERDNLGAIIRDNRDALKPFVNLDRVDRCLKRFQDSAAADEDVSNVWKAACLALWLRQKKPSTQDFIPTRKEVR